MPVLSRGNIFDAAARVQLAIVFGHIGFNEMGQHWVTFASGHPRFIHVRDPFTQFVANPVEWDVGRWLWFVPDTENHGMTDADLSAALDAALAWASANRITSISTNGVANIDHGRDTVQNQASDAQRAAFMQAWAINAEHNSDVRVELISLNDVFVRQPM